MEAVDVGSGYLSARSMKQPSAMLTTLFPLKERVPMGALRG